LPASGGRGGAVRPAVVAQREIAVMSITLPRALRNLF
jgi:hypothetical protein